MKLISWIGLALLGIVIAAAVSIAASRLASQQIGLSSEPISAGDALAPRREHRPAQGHSSRDKGSNEHGNARHHHPSSPPTQPATPVSPTPNPPAGLVEPTHTNSDGEHGGGADD